MTAESSYRDGYTFDEQHFRNDTTLKGLLESVVGQDMRAHMSEAQRARAAWFSANGDVERRHTCGVYLDKAPTRRELDPVLCVYVDSHVRLADFGANREVYLARLAGAGLRVSGIRFRLSDARHARRGQDHPGRDTSGVSAAPPEEALPELADEQRRRIDTMTQDLPDDLRPKVKRAMELSFRREMLDNSQK